jgi:integrase
MQAGNPIASQMGLVPREVSEAASASTSGHRQPTTRVGRCWSGCTAVPGSAALAPCPCITPREPGGTDEKEPQGRLRWLTREEITRLLEAAAKSRNKELRSAVIVVLNTGLRLGELLGLTWERVDLSRGVIRLELTKSGRRRAVPLNAESYDALVTLSRPGLLRVV